MNEIKKIEYFKSIRFLIQKLLKNGYLIFNSGRTEYVITSVYKDIAVDGKTLVYRFIASNGECITLVSESFKSFVFKPNDGYGIWECEYGDYTIEVGDFEIDNDIKLFDVHIKVLRRLGYKLKLNSFNCDYKDYTSWPKEEWANNLEKLSRISFANDLSFYRNNNECVEIYNKKDEIEIKLKDVVSCSIHKTDYNYNTLNVSYVSEYKAIIVNLSFAIKPDLEQLTLHEKKLNDSIEYINNEILKLSGENAVAVNDEKNSTSTLIESEETLRNEIDNLKIIIKNMQNDIKLLKKLN